MKYIDLHNHSRYSDGSLRPEDIAMNQAMCGIEAWSLTDHDNTAGLKEAAEASKKYMLDFIPGVEISTEKYHVLAYNFNVDDKKLQGFLQNARNFQEEKIKLNIQTLQSMGFPVTFNKIKDMFPNARLGKGNLQMLVCADPDCKEITQGLTPREIYFNYLTKRSDYSGIKIKENTTPETIKVIHDAGGIAVLAHWFKDVEHESELDLIVEQGIDGFEYQPTYGDRNGGIVKFAKDRDLLVTYGSDYHGPRLINRPLIGSVDNKSEEFWKN